MAASEVTVKTPKIESVETDNVEDETCRTFIIHEEDHTLGNALRYVIMKNPDTEFCGYAIPHPSENKINLRIQTRGPTAVDVLKKGLNDLNDVCQCVLDTFEVFLRRSDLTDRIEVDLFKVADNEREGMILTSGRIWKESRRFALHMMRDFGMGKIGAEDNILQECEKSIKAFNESEGLPLDPLPIINMAVSNVINAIVFGKQFQYDDERFQRSLLGLNEFMRMVSKPKTAFLLLPIGRMIFRSDLNRLQRFYKMFDDFIIEEMDEHKRSYEGQVTDFIYAYLAEMETKEDKSVFNEKQLRYIIQDLFIAGSETTFTTLRWALLYMAAYPDVQQKVFKELHSVVGNRAPSMSDRKSTPYTEAVLSEIQRLNTLIGLGVAHTSVQGDFDIEGYSIPKSTPVMANLHKVHRDPRYWKKPNEFYPENFIDDDGHFVNGDKLVPFSIGRRQCAGESLARMELYLFFSSWISHFCIKPETDKTVPDLTGMGVGINQPKSHKIRMIPRVIQNGNSTQNGTHSYSN